MAKKIDFSKGLQGKKEVLENLNHLMQMMGQKYSVRIGIIGEKASEKHSGTNLTNAELGAVHEFGATINIKHPGGQPYIIKENGQAQFVKKSSPAGIEAIKAGRVTKPYDIRVTVPTRSFLRMPLLSPEGKKALFDAVQLDISMGGFAGEHELYKKIKAGDFTLDSIAYQLAGAALDRVKEAFKSSGFGKWPPITEYTKEHRLNDKTSNPLQDGGELLDSITIEVKKLNG